MFRGLGWLLHDEYFDLDLSVWPSGRASASGVNMDDHVR